MVFFMRAYYNDSYTTEFSAVILESLQLDGKDAIILDKIYFYPTGGGQPHDIGEINGIRVIDVIARKPDNVILHILEAPLPIATEAICRIDWDRRFGLMQHHTGQHILSQAFVQIADAQTVGFHLSLETVTIDLDQSRLSELSIDAVETLANQVVFDNLAVTTRIIAPDAAEGIRMRRVPEILATDGLRVVAIGEFDKTACGGTHVAHTGEIGLIKIVRVEKRGEKLRVEFRCGGRALADYRHKNQIINGLTAELTCAADDLPAAIERLREEAKTLQRDLKSAQHTLLLHESTLLQQGSTVEEGGIRIIVKTFADRDLSALKTLAMLLIEQAEVVVLLAAYGERSQFVLARSATLPFDLNRIFKSLSADRKELRGGGQAAMVQGGGAAMDENEATEILREVRMRLFS